MTLKINIWDYFSAPSPSPPASTETVVGARCEASGSLVLTSVHGYELSILSRTQKHWKRFMGQQSRSMSSSSVEEGAYRLGLSPLEKTEEEQERS